MLLFDDVGRGTMDDAFTWYEYGRPGEFQNNYGRPGDVVRFNSCDIFRFTYSHHSHAVSTSSCALYQNISSVSRRLTG